MDISARALKIARINVSRHQLRGRVHLIKSDLFSNVPHKKYDLIVSNPPYVNAKEMKSLPPEYRHEPSLGLYGGIDGLDIIIKILNHAKAYLKPHGVLMVETGNAEEALITRFPKLPLTWLLFEHSEGGVFMITAKDLKKVKR